MKYKTITEKRANAKNLETISIFHGRKVINSHSERTNLNVLNSLKGLKHLQILLSTKCSLFI